MSNSGFRQYLLAIDDSGMQIIRPPTDGRAFMLGGIVMPQANAERFRDAWRAATKDFELVTTGNRPRVSGDIKAIDFLHNFKHENLDERRMAAPALAVFAQISEAFDLLPFLLVVEKSEAGEGILGRTHRGDKVIKPTELLPLLAGMFGAFLSRRNTYGAVRMDRLKNETEESDFRAAWEAQVNGIRKISRNIDFVESADFPEVQAADVLLGLLRGVYERDWEIPKVFGDLLRKAETAGIRAIRCS